VRFAQNAGAGKCLRDVRGSVGRAVVDDKNFEAGIVQGSGGVQTFGDRCFGVVGADDHRNGRPLRV
jgi:hypothetical protein